MSTYTPIATQTLNSATSSVTFSSIPQGYTDLILRITGNNNQGTAYISWLTFNNDTSTNYSYTRIVGTGTAAASTRDTSSNYGFGGWTNNQTSQMILSMNHIQNYSNSTTYKTWLVRGGDTTDRVYASVGLWRKTEPITSIKIQVEAGTYDAGSTFSIYGIAGGGVTAKAVGGILTTSGGYAYHVFKTSGLFTAKETLTTDILVVGGGGGGGKNVGGGGGAGGLQTFTSQSLLNNSYPIIVGAGGIGAQTHDVQGFSGSYSTFSSLSPSYGGGGGGGAAITQGLNGGSGGGSSWPGSVQSGGLGTAGQGNNGGSSLYFVSGGGGGAGAVGANATGSGSGAGGIGGTSSLINNIGAATSTGQLSGGNYYYAGGGGGGGYIPQVNGAGGLGGGGAGGTTVGTENTGGGGGGNPGGSGYGPNGNNGGSGIVIIRYLL